ncbi:MAG: hypothetical protein C4589_10080 [Peptococcaceae bacterium]|nr:MAG: hypothetical protein C4589_10080 [Peptococcaceae bacterium]
MKKLKLGQSVEVTAKIVYGIKTRKIEREILEDWKSGYIVGIRVLKEGWADFQSECLMFEPTNFVRVYLVAVSLSKTMYVLPGDIMITERVGKVNRVSKIKN